jgi:hypothetical protein
MDEYGLSPDGLIAKDFRVIQSSRRDYFPHGRKDWITAIKAAYKRDRNLTTKGLQLTCPALYHQGVYAVPRDTRPASPQSAAVRKLCYAKSRRGV